MGDGLRPADYTSFRDAATDILGRHKGADALAAFGLDDLFAACGADSDLTPAYAFLEAQGYAGATTPALALLGLPGCPGLSETGLMLGTRLGRTSLVGIPGYAPDGRIAIDHPGIGLIALPDVTPAVQTQPFTTSDDYVTVIDPGLVSSGAATLITEEQMDGRRAAVLARTQLGAAAELLGIVDRLLTDAITYAQQRRQFGHPIASYQSMQHLLAWGATERHQLTSLFDIAVAQAAVGETDTQLVRTVKAMAGRTLHAVAQTAIQATGAISFTWEYPQHHHHRRGLVLDQLGGASADLVAVIGREVRSKGAVPELFSLEDATR